MARTVGRWDLNVATKTSFRNFLQSQGMPNSATGRANSDQGLPTHYKGSVRHPLRQDVKRFLGFLLKAKKVPVKVPAACSGCFRFCGRDSGLSKRTHLCLV